ncbi:ArsR/SmtB family transcription factor [Bacillus sp. B1-b2]|uniref:ArsR/SmtB family transcription factor n=1 Tax=Bacillus sp. B1-b2 TaxID=2653201 RepID=UPI00126224E6|nr:winged helix-turn-helix domain-containing protein [Bacillus sp. B1-b2]KAB7672077.1 winged helix-turn-helix transcriptional regulator [Bacillus sp. B1-b2]
MKTIYSTLPQENVTISIDYSSVWEIALGIAGYTYTQLRHTFEFDEIWNDTSMSPRLIKNLNEIQDTNLWYGILLMQSKLAANTILEFSDAINTLTSDEFYEALLPYKDRINESFRQHTAKNLSNLHKYASLFKKHEYLVGYVLSLSQRNKTEIISLFIETLSDWYDWFHEKGDWKKWMQALSFEEKQNVTIDYTKPYEEIERITGGVKYLPEPSIWNIKLIPHVSYRPWLLELRTNETKLFFYPIKEESLLEPGVPSQELIRGHKALGDELRLKLLYQIMRGPHSLQELSTSFNVTKTTLHHQLSLLKAAKFITVDKGTYSANTVQIQSFTSQLHTYLGDK